METFFQVGQVVQLCATYTPREHTYAYVIRVAVLEYTYSL